MYYTCQCSILIIGNINRTSILKTEIIKFFIVLLFINTKKGYHLKILNMNLSASRFVGKITSKKKKRNLAL